MCGDPAAQVIRGEHSYGKGFYFSESCRESLSYSRQHGDGTLLLARVLVGARKVLSQETCQLQFRCRCGAAHMARHVVGCHFTQCTRIHHTLDDVAGPNT